MQQSFATPSLHLWFWGVAEDCCMLSILLAVPSCFNSFWHIYINSSVIYSEYCPFTRWVILFNIVLPHRALLWGDTIYQCPPIEHYYVVGSVFTSDTYTYTTYIHRVAYWIFSVCVCTCVCVWGGGGGGGTVKSVCMVQYVLLG